MHEQGELQAAERSLYDIAETQAGYFSTAQARAAGYSQRQLTYYVRSGRFARVSRGIYRLALYPGSPNEDLYAAQLQAGPSSVISHDTALALYGLSDALPTRIHLTICKHASRRHPHLRLHTSHLDPEDITLLSGLRVTTVPRTIADVAVSGLADELVIQAIREAVDRGLLTRDAMIDYAQERGGRTHRLVSAATQEIKG